MGRARIRVDEGKVTTPFNIALRMVDKLFRWGAPPPGSRLLDAGCGEGVFIEAVIAWCSARGVEAPEIVGVEVDPALAAAASSRFSGVGKVKIVQGDFLLASEGHLGGKFDYIVSNPPYISYERIDPAKRALYRRLFRAATGRFDVYMLFFEKALSLLKPGGRLVFITPEKYLYVLSARELRRILARYHVEEVELVEEGAFRGVLAYPAITVITKEPPGKTVIRTRDGLSTEVVLPSDGSPWLPQLWAQRPASAYRLGDIALRISAGVATGRDDVYVVPKAALPRELERFAYPTVSGSELSRFRPGEAIDYGRLEHVILVPYDREGRLLGEGEAGPLISYLSRWRAELESRYAVRAGGKKWYAFHEDPPLRDMLRPKILWRDIAGEPAFYVDPAGLVIPRHTVYYLVPRDPSAIPALVDYLNSSRAREWLRHHCQRAANGYLRLQSHVLREMPIPADLFPRAAWQGRGVLERWAAGKHYMRY